MSETSPIIAIIAAMARNGVIGNANTLPWSLPADLQHFRELTWGKPIIMGRKTAESLGKALPGRENIVISRQTDLTLPGMEIVHDLDEALAGHHGEVLVIGGAEIYRQAIPHAGIMYLTMLDAEFEGDTMFPAYVHDDWEQIDEACHPADQKNPYPYRFVTLCRR